MSSGRRGGFAVDVSRVAEADLRWLGRHGRKTDEVVLRAAFTRYLEQDPLRRSNIRQPMDPNAQHATWELRLGALRALYDVDEEHRVVTVLRAGFKIGNDLFLSGQYTPLR